MTCFRFFGQCDSAILDGSMRATRCRRSSREESLTSRCEVVGLHPGVQGRSGSDAVGRPCGGVGLRCQDDLSHRSHRLVAVILVHAFQECLDVLRVEFATLHLIDGRLECPREFVGGVAEIAQHDVRSRQHERATLDDSALGIQCLLLLRGEFRYLVGRAHQGIVARGAARGYRSRVQDRQGRPGVEWLIGLKARFTEMPWSSCRSTG